ncbi:heme-binding protein [Streptomyces sp. NPDC006285]|uniref:GlcG/HbpS family heme-binding protein n=1 Tax=Streptomyces sp. NPDC006285 TaxID=3364742 RepID=UPI0036909778
MNFTAAIALTDQGGHLKAFDRADNAPFLTAEVALDKAWTAASFHIPTHRWNDYLTNPRVAPLAGPSRLMAVGGGYPIIENGRCIGGLGISGGSYEQDQQAAEKALATLGFELPASTSQRRPFPALGPQTARPYVPPKRKHEPAQAHHADRAAPMSRVARRRHTATLSVLEMCARCSGVGGFSS